MGKKLITFILIAACVLPLAACRQPEEGSSRPENGESRQEEQSSVPDSESNGTGSESNGAGNESNETGSESSRPEESDQKEVYPISATVSYPKEARYDKAMMVWLYPDAVVYHHEAVPEESMEDVALALGQAMMEHLKNTPFAPPEDETDEQRAERRRDDYRIVDYKDLTSHTLIKTSAPEYEITYDWQYICSSHEGIHESDTVWAVKYSALVREEGCDWRRMDASGGTVCSPMDFCLIGREENGYRMVRISDVVRPRHQSDTASIAGDILAGQEMEDLGLRIMACMASPAADSPDILLTLEPTEQEQTQELSVPCSIQLMVTEKRTYTFFSETFPEYSKSDPSFYIFRANYEKEENTLRFQECGRDDDSGESMNFKTTVTLEPGEYYIRLRNRWDRGTRIILHYF